MFSIWKGANGIFSSQDRRSCWAALNVRVKLLYNVKYNLQCLDKCNQITHLHYVLCCTQYFIRFFSLWVRVSALWSAGILQEIYR